MKILHDYQTIVRQHIGGVSRYHYELVSHMEQKEGIEVKAPCVFSQNYYFEKWYGKKAYSYNKSIRNAVLILNDVLTFFRILGAAMFGKPYDVVHMSWYKPFYVKPLKFILRNRCPKIALTVHDLVHEMKADEADFWKRGAKDRRRMLNEADIIIAISENTKNDLLHYYPWVDLDKISVVYHGCLAGMEEDEMNYDFPNQYVLYVGARSSYKNFARLIEAMGKLKLQIPELQIVCAGGGL